MDRIMQWVDFCLRVRTSTPWADKSNFGLVFAIENVVMADGSLLPGAAEAIKWLLEQKKPIPFAFVTNLDGFTDHLQKDTLIRKFEEASIPITARRVVVRGKPFAFLVDGLGFDDEHVLVFSGQPEDEMRSLAEKCGFKPSKVWTPQDYLNRTEDVPLKAVMVWSDYPDWDEALDVMDSAFRSNPNAYLLVCCDDFVRATGGGAYRSISSHVVTHMLDNANVAVDDSDTAPRRWRWANRPQVIPVDNYGASICGELEARLEQLILMENGRVSDMVQTVYFITSNLLQDAKNVERHLHRTRGGPRWRTFLVGGSLEDGIEGDREYSPDASFPDIKAAVSAALAEQKRKPVP
jgi:hypothetical protein